MPTNKAMRTLHIQFNSWRGLRIASKMGMFHADEIPTATGTLMRKKIASSNVASVVKHAAAPGLNLFWINIATLSGPPPTAVGVIDATNSVLIATLKNSMAPMR